MEICNIILTITLALFMMTALVVLIVQTIEIIKTNKEYNKIMKEINQQGSDDDV